MGTKPRMAAGRARALGLATRGTTNPNRLRRMDNWIAARLGALLRAADDPLVIDLGYGATPVTTIELATRLRAIRPDVRVIGLEIDPERVAAAQAAADPPRLIFARGGFELAGRSPVLVRAANVLRQYPEADAAAAWTSITQRLAPGGILAEGTCDEIGRRGAWVLLDEHGPRELTLACKVATLDRPSELAERLPKALIHHNVPGAAIHAFLRDFDAAWAGASGLAVFGARQPWVAACEALAAAWPVDAGRARHGEISVAWQAVSP
jgi:hypothetical protein